MNIDEMQAGRKKDALIKEVCEERDRLSIEATDWSEAWKKASDECTVKTTAIANLHDVIKEKETRIRELEEELAKWREGKLVLPSRRAGKEGG